MRRKEEEQEEQEENEEETEDEDEEEVDSDLSRSDSKCAFRPIGECKKYQVFQKIIKQLKFH